MTQCALLALAIDGIHFGGVPDFKRLVRPARLQIFSRSLFLPCIYFFFAVTCFFTRLVRCCSAANGKSTTTANFRHLRIGRHSASLTPPWSTSHKIPCNLTSQTTSTSAAPRAAETSMRAASGGQFCGDLDSTNCE